PRCEGPREGAADVVRLADCNVVVHLGLLSETALAGVEIRALGDGEEELGVPPADLLGFRRFVEPFERILADRVEQGQTPFGPASHESLLDQRLERVEIGLADGLGCLDGEAARERRELPEELLFPRFEKVVAPFDRGTERSLPRRYIVGPARGERQPPFDPRQQPGRPELGYPAPRGLACQGPAHGPAARAALPRRLGGAGW